MTNTNYTDTDYFVNGYAAMKITFVDNTKGSPAGKLADAALVFTEGALAGLQLQGFAVWERRGGGERNVTFPARQYVVNGERRSFSLLRPAGETGSTVALKDHILAAYAKHEAARGQEVR